MPSLSIQKNLFSEARGKKKNTDKHLTRTREAGDPLRFDSIPSKPKGVKGDSGHQAFVPPRKNMVVRARTRPHDPTSPGATFTVCVILAS